MKRFTCVLIAAAVLLSTTQKLEAACMNKFLVRSDGVKRTLTLLTGMLTFPEAQELSREIRAGKKRPLELLDESGKVLTRQIGDLKIVQPMPVGCGGKTSGVVMSVAFMTSSAPAKKVTVRIDEATTVAFDEQGVK